MITNLKLMNENIWTFIKQTDKNEYLFQDEQRFKYYLNEFSKWRVSKISRNHKKSWEEPKWNDFNKKHKIDW